MKISTLLTLESISSHRTGAWVQSLRILLFSKGKYMIHPPSPHQYLLVQSLKYILLKHACQLYSRSYFIICKTHTLIKTWVSSFIISKYCRVILSTIHYHTIFITFHYLVYWTAVIVGNSASSLKHEKIDCPIFLLITTAVINFSDVVVSNYFLDQIPTVLLHWSWSPANEPLPNIVWNIYPRHSGSVWCKHI